jgi:arsenite methyltransferase
VALDARRRGRYGIDAPYLLPIPVILILVNVVNGVVERTAWPFIPAALIAVSMAVGLHASRRGKFVVWARLLDGLGLRGNERILDLGCGRGAVLLLAAQAVPAGRAIGVDLWRGGDQSGNAADATRRNAELEGVADRVELHTADMTALPLESASVDVVVSSVAIHNVKSRDGRARVIAEALRVLRPGGRLLLADIFSTREYQEVLERHGVADVARRGLGWRMWWSGPWLATTLVTASKPAAG